MSERVLIVGAGGLLGGALQCHWEGRGQPVVPAVRRAVSGGSSSPVRLDLAEPVETWGELPEVKAAVLCAAVTSLDTCRRDPAGTRQVNVVHTLALARRLAERGAFVVFLSTNLVFDGSRPLRRAGEPVSPQTEYGRQKAEVEAGLAALNAPSAVIRLTKVLNPRWPMIQGWLHSLALGQVIAPFGDLVCSPITLADTVQVIAQVAEKRRTGVWQVSARTDLSYAEIAVHLARRRGLQAALIQPGSGRLHPGLEHVPAHTTLEASATEAEFGVSLADPLRALDMAYPA